jgi:predicted nucleic acid-binding protein
MAGRDPEDWPTVAVALSLSVPVWSQDRDFEASGLRIYTTGELLDALGEAEA